MKSIKEFSLWPIAPYGGEDQESENEGESNPPAPKVDSKPPESPPDDDDEDEFRDYSPKELRRLARDLSSRAKTAEAERDSAKTKLTQEERSKLDKEQRLEAELADEKATNASLRAINAKMAIINAINSDSRYEWHNPEIVAQQLNSETVKVDEKGNVEGIAKELARVAKDHSYLLKKKQGQQNTEQSGGPTGFQPGQGGATQGGTQPPQAQELLKTYPALASRLNH